MKSGGITTKNGGTIKSGNVELNERNCPKSLPADSIFAVNHLTYAISSEDNVRAYLIQALSIDEEFVNRFNVHDIVSALEHTLYFRPQDIPTETYLKSQRLWIMHKLLMKMDGLGDKIQLLMQQQNSDANTMKLRSTLCSIMENTRSRAFQTTQPLYLLLEDMWKALNTFQNENYGILSKEKEFYVGKRCEIIRWFSWIVCNNGEQWIRTASQNDLEKGLYNWATNKVKIEKTQ